MHGDTSFIATQPFPYRSASPLPHPTHLEMNVASLNIAQKKRDGLFAACHLGRIEIGKGHH